MFENKTTDTLQAEMLNNINNEYDKTEGSFFYDVTKSAAIALSQIYKDIDNVVDKLNIENLSGDELEQRVKERTGITRKLATKSTGVLSVTGNGSINTGDLFESDSGVKFKATESKTIVTSGTISIECVESGSIGNLPVNTIKNMPVTIPGIVSVTNPQSTTGGYNAEIDSDLLKRYYERIQTPATSGNKAQFRNWAKEVTGVGDARVIPLWAGDNTVKVIIINNDKQPADAQLIEDVQNYIDPGISGLGDGVVGYIGVYCTVISAIGKPIDISFTATKDPAYTNEQIQTAIEYNLTEYLKEIAFVENYVSYAKIGSLILQTDGIVDYTDLLVNGGTVNINIDITEVATLGGVVIG
jgi:uncharacterized phage protein gp47/JayE